MIVVPGVSAAPAYTVRHGGADLSCGAQAAESSRSARYRGDRRGSRGASGFPERGGQAGRFIPDEDCPELERATGLAGHPIDRAEDRPCATSGRARGEKVQAQVEAGREGAWANAHVCEQREPRQKRTVQLCGGA
jgi:hypothetical protein